MNRRGLISLSASAAGLALSLVIARSALAGPPQICHAVDIGEAASLPWGSGPFDEDKCYDADRLIDDTVGILDGSDSVLVHMETLRRATLYIHRDEGRASEMLSRLAARTLDAEVNGRPNALAWLDAGYLAQCLHQAGLPVPECGTAGAGVIGYDWVCRAIELRSNDAELEFAAAMMTVMADVPEHEKHVARVKELAADDSLVLVNLRQHSETIWRHARGRG